MSLIQRLRLRLTESHDLLALAILGCITGLASGAVILLFRHYTDAAILLWGEERGAADFELLPAWLRFALPAFGGAIVGIILHRLPAATRNIGVGHVLERVTAHQGHLPKRNAFVQFFAGGLILASGMSVGREGPAIHLGSAVSSQIGKGLRLPNNSMRVMVGCGTAAAIAACFNTPLAGVIFALEVVLMEYTLHSFVPIILAAVCSTVLAQATLGDDIAFIVPPLDFVSLWEISIVVVLGLLAGLWSAMFIALTTRISRLTKQWPYWLRPTLGGVLVGSIALLVPQIMGTGYDTVNAALHSEVALTILFATLIGKTIATAACSGMAVPGGVIGPSMMIGAMLGGTLGIAVAQFAPFAHSPSGFYAMIGLAAMMSATLQAPMSALIALLELTGNPNAILPGMLAVVVASLVCGYGLKQRSLVHELLALRGVELRVSALHELLRRVSARSVMDAAFAQTSSKMSRTAIRELLRSEPRWLLIQHETWPLILMHANDVARNLLEDSNEEINLLAIAGHRENTVAVSAQATLAEVLDAMNGKEVNAAYLMDDDQKILGIITRGRIESYYTYKPS